MLYEYFIFKMWFYVCLYDGILLGQPLPFYSFRDNSSWFWSGVCRRRSSVINLVKQDALGFAFILILTSTWSHWGRLSIGSIIRTPRYFIMYFCSQLNKWGCWGSIPVSGSYGELDKEEQVLTEWIWIWASWILEQEIFHFGASPSELLQNFGVLLNLQLMFKGQITAVTKQL